MLTSGLALVLFAMAAFSQSQGNPAVVPPETSLESFYVASFNGNEWMIIDVQPLSDADSKARFIRVYRACGSYRVQEVDHVFEGVSVRQLAGDADICVPEQKLSKEVRRVRLKKHEQETEEWRNFLQGIEAQCGTEKVVHHLPESDLLRFEVLETRAPQIAALWTLPQQILERYAAREEEHYAGRESQLYIDHPPDRYLSQQAAIEIRNGDYDLALPPLLTDFSLGTTQPLSEVIPTPEQATDDDRGNVGVVENIAQMGLLGDTTIPYPQMALIANLQGDVVLKVSVNQSTGSVQNVAAISGHPLLIRSASDAIAAWKFPVPHSGENPLTTVHFEVHCPPTIDTTTSTGRSPAQRRKKKPKK